MSALASAASTSGPSKVEGHHRSAANGWAVLERVEHRGQPPGIADRPERRDRRLTTARVVVLARHPRQGPDGRGVADLAQGERRGVDREGVDVVEPANEGVAHRGRARRPAGGLLARLAPYRGVAVGDEGAPARRVELAATGETAEGDDALAGRPVCQRPLQPGERRGPGVVTGAHEGLEGDRYRVPIVGHVPIPPPDRVRRRWRTLAGAVLALVLAAVVAARIPLNEYALTPGNATPVTPLVSVHGVATARHPGTIYLTDVYLQQLNALSWVTLHLSSHVQFVPADALTPPGVPTSELAAQGYLQMRDAQLAAEVEAFRTVGWRVPAARVGATLTGVVVPSPASRAGLAVGDVVTAVGGRPVLDACGLVAALHGLAPGSVVRLGVRRVRISPTGVLSWRPARRVRVRTTAPPAGVASSGCPGVSGPDRSFLGVALEDDVAYHLPARVRIDTANIGGPSAGLAMTLALVDLLSRHSITGGRDVAATGTMAVGGAVGPVGGVAEKAVAVERAGARVFIVPRSEMGAAHSGAPGLRVLGVTTLAQALADLRSLGGAAPDPLSAPRATSG